MKKKNTWMFYNDRELDELENISNDYKEFISNSKTEREATNNIVRLVEEHGFKNLDSYSRYLKNTNPDAYQMINEVFKMLGLDLDITTQDHPLITLYGKYIDSGKKKTHLIAEMKKFFNINVADDRSSSNINTLKKVNTIQETNTHKRMEAFAKSKVADIDNDLEKIAFDIKTNVIPTILYEEQGMNYDDAVKMFAMLDELFPYY